ASGAMALADLSAASLAATAGGALSDDGPLTVSGATVLAAGATNDITLDAANSFGGPLTVLSGRHVVLNSVGALELGSSTVSGDLAVTAGGAVTQAPLGTLAVTGTTTLSAAGFDITLDNLGNDFGAALAATGHTVTLRDTNALALGSSTVSGDLAVTAGGAISDDGPLTVSGATVLAAGATNDITLDAANSFGGPLTVLSGRHVVLNSVGALELGSSTVSGDLDVSANGAISVSGVVSTGNATLIATAGGIGGTGTVQGTNVALRAAGAIGTGGGRLQTTAGTLAAQADGGGVFVSETDAVTLADLGGIANRAGAGGVYDVQAGGALTVSGSGIAVPANAGTGYIRLRAGTGDLTIDQAVGFTGAGTGGEINLSSGSGNVALGADVTSASGKVLVEAAQAITRSAGRILTGDLALQAGGAIGSALAPLVTSVARIAATASGAIFIDESDAVSVALRSDSGGGRLEAGGNLDFAPVAIVSGAEVPAPKAAGVALAEALDIHGTAAFVAAGAITQAGRVRVDGVAAFDSGGADVTLNRADNLFGAAVDATGGSVTLRSSGALTLGVIDVTNLSATAGGAITQAAPLQLSGAAVFDAGGADITLTDAGNVFGGSVSITRGGAVSLRDSGALALGPVSAGSLLVTAQGAITDVGPLNVAGATALAAGGHDVVLDAGGQFGGGLTITDAGNVTVSAFGDLLLGSVTANGTLALVATGSLTATGSVQAPRLDLAVGGDALFGAPNAIGVLGSVSRGGSFTLHDGGGLLVVGPIGGAGAGAFTLSTTGGALDVRTPIAAAGAITLGGDGLSFGTLDAGGGISLDGGAGGIAQDVGTRLSTGALLATAQGPITLHTAVERLDVGSTGSGDVTIDELDSVRIDAIRARDGDIAFTADQGTVLIDEVEAGVDGGVPHTVDIAVGHPVGTVLTGTGAINGVSPRNGIAGQWHVKSSGVVNLAAASSIGTKAQPVVIVAPQGGSLANDSGGQIFFSAINNDAFRILSGIGINLNQAQQTASQQSGLEQRNEFEIDPALLNPALSLFTLDESPLCLPADQTGGACGGGEVSMR
ncbi:hypothetical protein EV699_1201, partial [Plasticicumulans lactativorans]